MTNRRTGLLLSLVLLLTAGRFPARAQTVGVWLTTGNQRTKMQQQPSVTFSPGGGGANYQVPILNCAAKLRNYMRYSPLIAPLHYSTPGAFDLSAHFEDRLAGGDVGRR